MTRLPITKTPKCFVGGAFIRSESGRVTALKRGGEFIANIPRCSRKDLRNAQVREGPRVSHIPPLGQQQSER